MKTQMQKPVVGKARYKVEYKREALEHWKSSGCSAAKIAAELGIRAPLLYRWAKEFRQAAQQGRLPEPLRSAAERYTQIEQMSGTHKLQWLCEALLVSRSGYYDWLRRRRAPGLRARENSALRARIRAEFIRSRQTYGRPRLTRMLDGAASRNRVARLMRQERL